MAKSSNEFQVFAKPVGPLCNLDCKYCYYVETPSARQTETSPHIPVELLEKYIVQHVGATSGPTTAFSWHGGEPTLAGLDHFRTIVSLQRRLQPPEKREDSKETGSSGRLPLLSVREPEHP